MASTNFLQWNPSQANQETDTQYATDTQRTGGAAVDSPFSSPLANKLFYQVSTFVYAFALFLQNAGVSTADTSATTLAGVFGSSIALLNNPQFTGTPTAPTPGNSDNSTRIATTAWVNNVFATMFNALFAAAFTTQLNAWLASLAKSLGNSGYITLPNGLILQWGTITTTTGNQDHFSFPITFPNAVYGMIVTDAGANTWGTTQGTIWGTGNVTTSGFHVSSETMTAGGWVGSNAADGFYLAVGR